MMNGIGEGSSSSLDDFLQAYENILDAMTAICAPKASRSPLSEEHAQTVRDLHSRVCSGRLQQVPSATETLSWCDGFISEWESSGERSAAVQQLISLLNRPHVRGVLVAAEDISSCRYTPQLPEVPFEVDEDDGIAVKIVRIMKKDEPLGATIKCVKGRVVIARILAGGVADRSACIQEGDRVLEVNGVVVDGNMSSEDFLKLLNRTDSGYVTFKLVPTDVHARSADHATLHVRALFDYDGTNDCRQPCRDTAMSFSRGDVLELLVCNDLHWWQARCVGHGAFSYEDDPMEPKSVKPNRIGLVPSELIQQKQRARERIGTSETLSSNSSKSNKPSEEEQVYESVCLLTPKLSSCRPVVLIGAPGVGRNELKRRLIMLFPERFSTTIPHTTRNPRPGEKHGIDYYFVDRPTMEGMICRGEMLEFGEYRGNLYGTALSAVYDARKNGIPLLTPHQLALKQLRTADLRPFVIFVQPPDSNTFKDTRDALRVRASRATSAVSTATSTATRGFTDAEIDKIIESSAQLDLHYGHLFDARLLNAHLEDSIRQLIALLQAVETRPTFVPLSWATRSA